MWPAACCPCQPSAVAWPGSYITPCQSPSISVAPSLLPGFVPRLVAVPVSPKYTLMQPGRGAVCCAPVGQFPRCFLCSACVRSAPLPLCKGEGERTDTSCHPASAPHPTHRKGEVAERRKSAPCSCCGCSSHIFSAAGSPSPRSLRWLPGRCWAHGETGEGWDPICTALQIWKGKGWIWGWVPGLP